MTDFHVTDEMLAELSKKLELKRLRSAHPYVVDLIRVLWRHGAEGIERQKVLDALERQREREGLPIPNKFQEAVQGSYNAHCVGYRAFEKSKLMDSEAPFFSPGGKGSGIWAVDRDKALTWLKKENFEVQS